MLSLLLLNGCASEKTEIKSGWVEMNEEKKISAVEIFMLKTEAKIGNISAGEKLYQHYTFSSNDANVIKSNEWLKWLANRGVVYAEFNYGLCLINDENNVKEGQMWMIKAKNDGYVGGDDLLKSYTK